MSSSRFKQLPINDPNSNPNRYLAKLKLQETAKQNMNRLPKTPSMPQIQITDTEMPSV